MDNDCKDTLDKLALRLQQMPNGKLEVVGYTDEKEVVSEQTLGSQRAVNVKYYLTTDGPTTIDANHIEPRQGGTKERPPTSTLLLTAVFARDKWWRVRRLTKASWKVDRGVRQGIRRRRKRPRRRQPEPVT